MEKKTKTRTLEDFKKAMEKNGEDAIFGSIAEALKNAAKCNKNKNK